MQPLPFSVHHLRLSGADREERRTPSRSPLPRPSRLPAPRYGRPWGSTAGRGACRTARPEARRLPFPPAKRRVKLREVKSAVRRRRGGGGVRSFVCFPPRRIFTISKRKEPSGHPESRSDGGGPAGPLRPPAARLRRRRESAPSFDVPPMPALRGRDRR